MEGSPVRARRGNRGQAFSCFLASTWVEKVHCKPSIAGADVFTEVYLPALSFIAEAGTEGAAKSLVCAYVTLSSGFVHLSLEFLELVVPEGD